MYIFEELKRNDMGVKRFQVVQGKNGALVINVVPDEGFGESTRERIEQIIKNKFSPRASVEIIEVDHIPREKSGKMRLIVGYRNGE
ncbi:MAG: hypothetical protein D3910_15950 [Candidatus Electrothrix sp. ATG2]|nr:hypothetical protein [Candidatus Electrothrix sp. ATG2]